MTLSPSAHTTHTDLSSLIRFPLKRKIFYIVQSSPFREWNKKNPKNASAGAKRRFLSFFFFSTPTQRKLLCKTVSNILISSCPLQPDQISPLFSLQPLVSAGPFYKRVASLVTVAVKPQLWTCALFFDETKAWRLHHVTIPIIPSFRYKSLCSAESFLLLKGHIKKLKLLQTGLKDGLRAPRTWNRAFCESQAGGLLVVTYAWHRRGGGGNDMKRVVKSL